MNLRRHPVIDNLDEKNVLPNPLESLMKLWVKNLRNRVQDIREKNIPKIKVLHFVHSFPPRLKHSIGKLAGFRQFELQCLLVAILLVKFNSIDFDKGLALAS